jgi:excinuclease ABC subunit C
MDIPERVKEKLRELPDKPGIYIMRDKSGRAIYVGKARSLRKRVRSYFQKGTLKSADPKLRGLVRSIRDISTLVCRSEAEATLTESKFIKEYRPHYNVDWRDDKRFLLLRVALDDPVPRFKTVRLKKDDGALYFGPYVNAASARTTLRFLEKRYGLRSCRPAVPGPDDYRHCSNDIIRYCSAPCVEKISREDYLERVKEACAFLKGQRPDVLKEVREEMERESKAMRFEKAAQLRDMYLLIKQGLRERARVRKTPALKEEEARRGLKDLQDALNLEAPPHVIETFDISNISGTHAVGSMVCAVAGQPARNRYRRFRIKTVEGIDDPGMMAEVVGRRYARLKEEGGTMPDLVLVDGGITQVRAARRALDALDLQAVPVAGLAKRFEELITDSGRTVAIRLPVDSPGLQVVQRIRDEAHRFALTYHRRLRSRRIRESMLDDVPGIGEKRKQQLLEHFGSIVRLRKATVDEVSQVPGIGPKMARQIVDQLAHDG